MHKMGHPGYDDDSQYPDDDEREPWCKDFEAHKGGKVMRPWLTTGECARILGMSVDYMRGEIRDGLLRAEVVQREARPGRTRGNRAIRIYRTSWREYLQRYWPQHPACSTFHENRENA